MPEFWQDIRQLAAEFDSCRQLLAALGDETRQHLILEMLKIEDCRGARVGAIVKQTHLSRPAVSHHLRILREAGILKVRREGTKNYYYFNEDICQLDRLSDLISHAKFILKSLPDRSGADD